MTEFGGEYYKGFAANMYLKLGKENAFVEVRQNNLRYGADYIELADYYRERKDIDTEVSLVEEALKKAEGRLDEVYVWLFQHYRSLNDEGKILELYEIVLKKKKDVDTAVNFLYEYYKEKSDYEKQKKYLLLMMKYSASDTARHWFDICKTELHLEDFESNRKKI